MNELEAILSGSTVSTDDVVIDSVTKIDKYSDGFVPRVRQTVTYIVCTVLVNDNNEILMVQEAKHPCRGKWYLPAGRMELNETVEAAAQREVLEESGLTYNPTTLVYIEAMRYHWLRFTLTGTVTGGKLKALDLNDKDSLQAQWFDMATIKSTLTVRAHDIFPLIHEILRRRLGSPPIHHSILPTNLPHSKMLLRLIVMRTVGENRERQVLVSLSGHTHLPNAMFYGSDSTIRSLLQNVFKHPVEPSVRIHGVVSLEHDGRPAYAHDGMRLTVLITLDNTATSNVQIADEKRYRWMTVTDSNVVQHLDSLSVGSVALRSH